MMLGWDNPYAANPQHSPTKSCEVCGAAAVNDGLCYQHFWVVMRQLAEVEMEAPRYLEHWAEFRQYEAVHS